MVHNAPWHNVDVSTVLPDIDPSTLSSGSPEHTRLTKLPNESFKAYIETRIVSRLTPERRAQLESLLSLIDTHDADGLRAGIRASSWEFPDFPEFTDNRGGIGPKTRSALLSLSVFFLRGSQVSGVAAGQTAVLRRSVEERPRQRDPLVTIDRGNSYTLGALQDRTPKTTVYRENDHSDGSGMVMVTGREGEDTVIRTAKDYAKSHPWIPVYADISWSNTTVYICPQGETEAREATSAEIHGRSSIGNTRFSHRLGTAEDSRPPVSVGRAVPANAPESSDRMAESLERSLSEIEWLKQSIDTTAGRVADTVAEIYHAKKAHRSTTALEQTVRSLTHELSGQYATIAHTVTSVESRLPACAQSLETIMAQNIPSGAMSDDPQVRRVRAYANILSMVDTLRTIAHESEWRYGTEDFLSIHRMWNRRTGPHPNDVVREPDVEAISSAVGDLPAVQAYRTTVQHGAGTLVSQANHLEHHPDTNRIVGMIHTFEQRFEHVQATAIRDLLRPYGYGGN